MLLQNILTSQWLTAEELPASELTLIRASRRAMATTFEIALPMGTPNAIAAAEDCLDLIDELEDQLTVYRDHSEVSRLNANAYSEPVTVEPQLFELLQNAQAVHRDTDGAFDIATGSLIKAWGFFKRQPAVPESVAFKVAMQANGFRHVVLDTATRSVRFLRPGLEFNLGGIGKGYALDRVADKLRRDWGITCALLHGGGSSVLALGAPPNDSRGWLVALTHPADSSRTLGSVRLQDRALATSAATFQFFEYKEKKLGHLLDPRSGWPASGTASANVIAPTASEADALSTAFFVLGHSAAEEYCRSRPHLATVMLSDADDTPRAFGFTPGEYGPPGLRETLRHYFTLSD
ncbi:FAD:protein FMN transferase [soil metagenome]